MLFLEIQKVMSKSSFEIIYQSEAVKVIDKPSGVISTDISDLICHRLDKDTSGLLIVAKNKQVKADIQQQFKERKIKKAYLALVPGKFEDRKRVEGWLERDAKNSRLMKLAAGFLKAGDEFSQIEKTDGKNRRYSKTTFLPKEVIYKKLFKANKEQFNYYSLIKCLPVTGRKHQIRAHLKYLDQPILGDDWYGSKISRQISQKLKINRLMLHAQKIEFYDPSLGNKQRVIVESKIPQDFNSLLNQDNCE